MNIKPSSYFLMAILVLMIISLIVTLQFTEPDAKLLPLITIGVISFLVIIELARELKTARKEKKTVELEQSNIEATARDESTRSLFALSWICGFALAVYLLGFLIAMPLFALVYLRLKSKKGWLIAISLAALLDIFIYFGFEVALQVTLFRGLFFGGI